MLQYDGIHEFIFKRYSLLLPLNKKITTEQKKQHKMINVRSIDDDSLRRETDELTDRHSHIYTKEANQM